MKTTAFAIGLLASTLAAQTAPAAAQDSEGWRFTLTPYIWAAGIQGDVGARPGNPPIEVDVKFTDIFDKLEGVFVGKLDVGYGRFGAYADIMYIKVGTDRDVKIGNLLTLDAQLDVATTAATIAGYYRVYDSAEGHLDLIAGARINSVSVDLDLSRVGGAGRGGEVTKTAVDPIIGFEAVARLGGRSSLTGYADIGGFDVSSKLVWQIQATYNYDISDGTTASIGYRYYAVDFKEGSLSYDLALGGPYIGVAFEF
jgi:hypothetical protein